jgi:cytochrome c peroxidase
VRFEVSRRVQNSRDEGGTLGRVLFYDKRLSLTNTHSCGPCHEQARGFAAPTRFSEGIIGEPTKRNAMGLTGVRYSIHDLYFSDMRVSTLEALALPPIQEQRSSATRCHA